MYQLKNNFCLLSTGTIAAAIALLTGCGGGGGGSSTPSPTAIPSPFDASYNATFTPSAAIPSDGRGPTGSLKVSGGKAALQTTFYIQPSVVTGVQNRINEVLNARGYGFAIGDNQFPSNITFSNVGQLDSSGKVVLTSRNIVNVCGPATLVVTPTFTQSGATTAATGTYQLTFEGNAIIKVRGRTGDAGYSCNNLPLRTGTVLFTR